MSFGAKSTGRGSVTTAEALAEILRRGETAPPRDFDCRKVRSCQEALSGIQSCVRDLALDRRPQHPPEGVLNSCVGKTDPADDIYRRKRLRHVLAYVCKRIRQPRNIDWIYRRGRPRLYSRRRNDNGTVVDAAFSVHDRSQNFRRAVPSFESRGIDAAQRWTGEETRHMIVVGPKDRQSVRDIYSAGAAYFGKLPGSEIVCAEHSRPMRQALRPASNCLCVRRKYEPLVQDIPLQEPAHCLACGKVDSRAEVRFGEGGNERPLPGV